MKAQIILLSAALAGCVGNGDVRESADARDSVHKNLEAQIEATRPVCSSDESCAIAWESVKQWALYFPTRAMYFANAKRVTITSHAGEFGLDIYLDADGETRRTIRVEKTCTMLRACFNAAATAILDMNATVNRALKGA